MSNDFGRVGVLYGGQSAEREVSLLSGKGVYEALQKQGVDVHLFDTGQNSLVALAQAGFDRVFIALHGRYGEDGTIQGALELLGIPYTGSGPKASGLALDKIISKRIFMQHGLPTPRFVELRCDDAQIDGVGLADKLGLPLIIKPPHEGSTLGLSKLDSLDQLAHAMQLACRYDDVALAEKFVQGRELTVPILGTGAQARALPVIEIMAPGGNYDYEHKYVSNETRYECPAELSAELSAEVQDIALRAYHALDCAGWGRADLIVDDYGYVWLLEMNTSPGMTSHSLVPMSAKAAGMDYEHLCLAILADASCKLRLSKEH